VCNNVIGMLGKEACHAQECALFAGLRRTGMQLGDLTQYGMAAGTSERPIMTLVEGAVQMEGARTNLSSWIVDRRREMRSSQDTK
jgi:hypothetical protein